MYQLPGTGGSAKGSHITIGTGGEKWCVNTSGAAFCMLPGQSQWIPIPGVSLKSIHCASGDYVVGVGSGAGDQNLYRWSAKGGWNVLSGRKGTHISITWGSMWHVNSKNEVYQVSI
jgi:hypothetical protein